MLAQRVGGCSLCKMGAASQRASDVNLILLQLSQNALGNVLSGVVTAGEQSCNEAKDNVKASIIYKSNIMLRVRQYIFVLALRKSKTRKTLQTCYRCSV